LFVSSHRAEQQRLSQIGLFLPKTAWLYARKFLLGVLTLAKTSKRFIYPQTTQNSAGTDFQHKKNINNFSTVHVISAQSSSITAACRPKLTILTQTLQIYSRGHVKNSNQ
jgi:hypothetical protein